MKKIVAILLAVLMLCMSVACAEAAEVFTFRNGLHWGMTPAEVLAVEGRAAADDEEVSYTAMAILLEDLALSKFEADISYLFVGGKLAALEIDPELWLEYDAEDIEYLKQALSIVYGPVDETLPVPAYVQNLLEMNGYAVTCGWQPAADTYIGIMNDGRYIRLGYFDVNVDYVTELQTVAPTPTPEPINTFGL